MSDVRPDTAPPTTSPCGGALGERGPGNGDIGGAVQHRVGDTASCGNCPGRIACGGDASGFLLRRFETEFTIRVIGLGLEKCLLARSWARRGGPVGVACGIACGSCVDGMVPRGIPTGPAACSLVTGEVAEDISLTS